MAVNQTRSMNTDLQTGITDGVYKSVVPDRGGAVELSDVVMRSQILPPQYGVLDHLKGLHDSACSCNYCG